MRPHAIAIRSEPPATGEANPIRALWRRAGGVSSKAMMPSPGYGRQTRGDYRQHPVERTERAGKNNTGHTQGERTNHDGAKRLRS